MARTQISASGKSTSAEETEEATFGVGPEGRWLIPVKAVAVIPVGLSSATDEVYPYEGEENNPALV